MTSVMAAALINFEALRETATAFRPNYLLIPTCRPGRCIGSLLGPSAARIIVHIMAKKLFYSNS
jgi:hypothetical protein